MYFSNRDPGWLIGSPTQTDRSSPYNNGAGRTCTPVPNVDEDCVNSYLGPNRPLGKWVPFFNDCNGFRDYVLSQCATTRRVPTGTRGGYKTVPNIPRPYAE